MQVSKFNFAVWLTCSCRLGIVVAGALWTPLDDSQLETTVKNLIE
eukprot:SAG31_NODE_39694_length_286_cov_0.834225_1_plen_44_part_01